jgi:hypothetical protein
MRSTRSATQSTRSVLDLPNGVRDHLKLFIGERAPLTVWICGKKDYICTMNGDWVHVSYVPAHPKGAPTLINIPYRMILRNKFQEELSRILSRLDLPFKCRNFLTIKIGERSFDITNNVLTSERESAIYRSVIDLNCSTSIESACESIKNEISLERAHDIYSQLHEPLSHFGFAKCRLLSSALAKKNEHIHLR